MDAVELGRHFPDASGISLLGAGGQKLVFAATHAKHGSVVIKLIHQNQDLGRVQREVDAVEMINSARVPAVLEKGAITDASGRVHVWLIETRIEGQCLRQVLQSGPVPFAQIPTLGRDLLEAIRDAEYCRIVHRDIKPDNVMVDQNGRFWLLDFGIARHLDKSSLTATVNAWGIGTPGYAPPEQYKNQKDLIRTQIAQGEVSLLSWSVSNAASLSLSGIGTLAPGSTQISVTPSATQTFTLTATNSKGTSTATVTVTVSGIALNWRTSLVYGFGQLLSEERPTGTIYLQGDQVGSPNIVTDASGQVIGRSKNLPYGERFGQSGQKSARRYTNHEDQPGSAIYMQARSYLPVYGKFAQPDPAYDQSKLDPESWNLFSYVTNNPVTHTDPDGREMNKLSFTQIPVGPTTKIGLDEVGVSDGGGDSGYQALSNLAYEAYNNYMNDLSTGNEPPKKEETEPRPTTGEGSGNGTAGQTSGTGKEALTLGDSVPTKADVLAELDRLATAYGIPKDVLKAVAQKESNFDTTAVNHNKNKKGEILSSDYGLMQINSSNIGSSVKGADGKSFKITDAIKTDWKANANAGAAMVSQEYKAAVRDQPNGTAQTRAQQTYSGYNAGPSGRERYTERNAKGGFLDGRDKGFLTIYQSYQN